MAVKEQIDKQLKRAAEDVAAAERDAKASPAEAPVAERDEELENHLAAAKLGYIKGAYRTRNGALAVTH